MARTRADELFWALGKWINARCPTHRGSQEGAARDLREVEAAYRGLVAALEGMVEDSPFMCDVRECKLPRGLKPHGFVPGVKPRLLGRAYRSRPSQEPGGSWRR